MLSQLRFHKTKHRIDVVFSMRGTTLSCSHQKVPDIVPQAEISELVYEIARFNFPEKVYEPVCFWVCNKWLVNTQIENDKPIQSRQCRPIDKAVAEEDTGSVAANASRTS